MIKWHIYTILSVNIFWRRFIHIYVFYIFYFYFFIFMFIISLELIFYTYTFVSIFGPYESLEHSVDFRQNHILSAYKIIPSFVNECIL
mgnify:CR=1 FL=1